MNNVDRADLELKAAIEKIEACREFLKQKNLGKVNTVLRMATANISRSQSLITKQALSGTALENITRE